MDKNTCYKGVYHSIYCKGNCGIEAPFLDRSKYAPKKQREIYANKQIELEVERQKTFVKFSNKRIKELQDFASKD